MTLPKTLGFKSFLNVDYTPGEDPLIKRMAKKRKGNETETSGPSEATQPKGWRVHAVTKDGEKLKSGLYTTKKQADDMHWKLAKGNRHKSVETVRESVEINEAAHPVDSHIAAFSKGIKSSPAKHSTDRRGQKIASDKHVTVDASHQEVFDHLKKMGFKKTSGYDPKPHTWDHTTNHDSQTKTTAPVHHSAGRVSAHITHEHGGKAKVHFSSWDVHESVEVDESVLSPAQRRLKALQMKRLAPKLRMGQERAKRRFADMDRLKKRAMKAARNKVFRSLSKDIPKDELTYQRRQEIEKRLDSPAMKARIERIAMKMLPKEREMEIQRHRTPPAQDNAQ